MKIIPLLLILLLLPRAGLAQNREQAPREPSLAEIARQTREARQGNTQPVRVITNDDLKNFANATVSTAQAAAEAQTETVDPESDIPAPAEAAPAEPDMAFWEAAFQEARLNLREAVNRGLVLNLRMNNLRNAYFAETDGVTQAHVQSLLEATLGDIEKNRLEVEEAQATVSLLQRRAREAGVTPGRIRELTGELPQADEILDAVTPTP